MKELYAELDQIAATYKKYMMTLEEAMEQMKTAVENYLSSLCENGNWADNSWSKKYWADSQKAYHRMFKILFEITKS